MQVGTYPTRNFATLGMSVTSTPSPYRAFFGHSASYSDAIAPKNTVKRVAGRSFLPASPCRHEDRTVSSLIRQALGVQSLRIPSHDGFLLIARTSRIVTADVWSLRDS